LTKRIVIVPDTQMPYDHQKAVKAVVSFIGEYQPDEVVHIGDLMDFPQPSRWTKDSRAEFEGSIFEDVDTAKRRFLEPLRAVYDGPIGVHEGNHDERPRVYLEKYAPALAQANSPFNIENLLDFDGFGIRLLPEFYDIAPGWISTHGHRGMIGMSPIAGNTATNAAKRFDVSVVMGHTHRLAIGSYSKGYGGTVKRKLHGMEVGHLMDMRKAGYLKGGTGNWQMGFGIITVESQYVKPEIVTIDKGRFTVDGRSWEV
jgi:predicted phosphodiesterase